MISMLKFYEVVYFYDKFMDFALEFMIISFSPCVDLASERISVHASLREG